MGLSDLILSKVFQDQILAIPSKGIYKRAKYHPNGGKMAIFQKITKIALRLGALPPDPILCNAGKC